MQLWRHIGRSLSFRGRGNPPEVSQIFLIEGRAVERGCGLLALRHFCLVCAFGVRAVHLCRPIAPFIQNDPPRVILGIEPETRNVRLSAAAHVYLVWTIEGQGILPPGPGE